MPILNHLLGGSTLHMVLTCMRVPAYDQSHLCELCLMLRLVINIPTTVIFTGKFSHALFQYQSHLHSVVVDILN